MTKLKHISIILWFQGLRKCCNCNTIAFKVLIDTNDLFVIINESQLVIIIQNPNMHPNGEVLATKTPCMHVQAVYRLPQMNMHIIAKRQSVRRINDALGRFYGVHTYVRMYICL